MALCAGTFHGASLAVFHLATAKSSMHIPISLATWPTPRAKTEWIFCCPHFVFPGFRRFPKVHPARVVRNTHMIWESLFVFCTNHLRVGGAKNETRKLTASDIKEGHISTASICTIPKSTASFFAQFHTQRAATFAQSRQPHQKRRTKQQAEREQSSNVQSSRKPSTRHYC